MRLFRRRRLSPIGLDVGTSSVKALQVAFDADGLRLVAAGEAPFVPPAGATAEDQAAARVSAIRTVLARHPFAGRQAVVALGGDQVDVRPTVVTGTPEDGLDEPVIAQVRRDFGFDPEAALLDYVAVDTFRDARERKTKVLAVMAARAAVDEIIEWTREAGLHCLALDATPFALARLVGRLRPMGEREPLAVLDLGSRHSTGFVMAGAALLSTRNIALGGETITQALMSGLDLDRRTAEAFKCGRDRSFELRIDDPDNEAEAAERTIEIHADRVLRDILWTRLDPLAQELNKLRSYCSAELRGAVPERLVPLGGGAYLDQLDGYLSEVVGIDIERHELGEMFVDGLPPDLASGNGPFAGGTMGYALAAGLALWGSPR